MSFLTGLRDRFIGAYAGALTGGDGLRATAAMAEEADIRESAGFPSSGADPLVAQMTGVYESAFAELELAFEDVGWRGLNGEYGAWNFKRPTLRRITSLSRVMYLANPLIKRAVTVQELYVWGRGAKIKGEADEVDQVLQDFFKDPKNQGVVGEAFCEREREQRIDGNTFFVFFVNRVNGSARVRLLPFDQIEDIQHNPEDSKEPWYYIRLATVDQKGTSAQTRLAYPDINYTPQARPGVTPDGIRILWDQPVMHIKTGGLSSMKFGLPELFSTLNWALGYKRILENFATVLAAYARMAMQITGLKGKDGIAAAKSKMNTALSSGKRIDSNPPPNTAAWFFASGGSEVKPIKTAGSTTGPDEARALRSMVAAGSDTPEHFFGDSDIGNFATSSTLDRPTELKMVARQQMWVGIIERMCQKLIEWSANAPQGKLRTAGYRARRDRDAFDGCVIITVIPPNKGSVKVNIDFPNILERDVTDRVRAVVQAATLGGSPAEGIFPDRKLLFKLLAEALGIEDFEYLTDEQYPNPVPQGFKDPADMMQDEHLTALGRKELGDAAVITAKNPKPAAPKPSGSPARGGNNR